MRLYPPVYAVAKDVVADDVIGGYRIPARSMILLSQYITHRHPEFWDDPERFDPIVFFRSGWRRGRGSRIFHFWEAHITALAASLR